jgi:transcriptional antiterminator RfaH
MEGSSMTNLPRLQLSADPGQVHYFRSPIIDHTPPETFEGFTWFVVVCNPKCERRAQLGLRRAGYQTYLPQTKRWVVHARKKEERENPLFPRYLFIGLREDQDFWKLRGVDGVEGIVRNDNRPVRVSGGLLARLLEREAAGEFDFTHLPDLGPQYTPGEAVRLTACAFNDLQARVVSMLSKGRVEVLVEFLGRKARLKVKHSNLVRV